MGCEGLMWIETAAFVNQYLKLLGHVSCVYSQTGSREAYETIDIHFV